MPRLLPRLLCGLALLPLLPAAGLACTLWGAAGSAAACGGTIAAKNRDWQPDHSQRLEITRPRKGHAYLGLIAVGGDDPGIKGGINDQGLAVISASAGSIPKARRKTQAAARGIIRKILSRHATVDQAVADRALFASSRAQALLLSDRGRLAVVEIGLRGESAVQVQADGTLAHANHFTQEPLTAQNQSISRSSRVRLARIQELLGERKPPYAPADFKAMSCDQSAGPDDSLWRTGSTPEKTRTLSTWIAEIPPQGPPKVYVKLADPGTVPRERELTLDAAFWDKPLPD